MRGSGSRSSNRNLNKRKNSDEVDFDQVENKMRNKRKKQRKQVDDDDDDDNHGATLPIDIVLDILLRLPVKTLSECKWVSKAWFRAIKHPRFVELHHKKVIENNSPCVILVDSYRKRYFLLNHEDLETFEPSIKSYKPKFPPRLSQLDSCNGLVFSLRKPYFLCNPITGDHMEIPKPWKIYGFKDIATGFGFDDVSKVFKFVRIMENMEEGCGSETLASIYNFATAKWRSISDVPYNFDDNTFDDNTTHNAFVNGAFHWIGHPHLKSTFSKVIITFKLDTEEFDQIPFPPKLRLDRGKCQPYLMVLEECLCMIHTLYNGNVFIWVRRNGSWFRKHTIEWIVMDGERVTGPYKPIQVLKNGEILLLCSNLNLGYYDPKTRKFRSIDIHTRLYSKSELQPLLHMGSLLSPKNVGKLEK